LIGTKNTTHLDENLGALTVTLTKEEIAELEQLMCGVVGMRYDEIGLGLLDYERAMKEKT